MIELGKEAQSWDARNSKRTHCRHCAKQGKTKQEHEDRLNPNQGWISICKNCGMVDKADA